MTLQEFYNKYVNQKNVGNTPENRGECVGLSSLWMDNFNIPHVYGHAKDLYNNAPEQYFLKIPNTPDAIIQDGDIAVWGQGYNGTFGHTGVAKGKHDLNSFECFQQNDPLGSTPHIKKYNYAYVIGWLRPRAAETSDLQKELDKAREERDKNWNLFQDLLKTTVSKEKYDTDIQSRDNQIKERDEEIKKITKEFEEYKREHSSIISIPVESPTNPVESQQSATSSATHNHESLEPEIKPILDPSKNIFSQLWELIKQLLG